ncbi:hypothetical protein BDY24DRAFT_384172 [Mrakia frigida]|uniref:uncharacterized protein n=1 Tax=Mrakia frigida TaxID=29902 RepID=UPI003FCC1F31
MFGEDYSESPKKASPWATPRIQTPSSSLSLSISQPLSSLASSSSSLHKSSSEEAEIFSGEVTSSGSEEDDVEELRDELAASSFSSPGAVGGAGRRSTVEANKSRPRRLSAEDDDKGHIEYKLKLTAATPDRFNRLVTQLKWRLLQGGGEAMYEIGVLDDGTLVGLSRTDLLASLRTLERMADELGATVVVLKEIRLAKNESTGSAGDDGGKRRKWEQWKAFADGKEKLAAAAATKDTSSKKPSSKNLDSVEPSSSSSNGPTSSASPSSSTPILEQSKSPTTTYAVAYSPNFAISPIADLPSSISATTDELHILIKSQDRSSKKKRYTSVLDDPPIEPSPDLGIISRPVSKANKVRRHKPIKQEVDSDDEGGMFSVFDLDLDASPPLKVKPAVKVSRKKAHEDEKAARRKLKRALKDEESMRCLWGGGEEVVVGGDEEEEGGWAGQSLDVWGDEGVEVDQSSHRNSNSKESSSIPLDAEVEIFSLPPSDHHLNPPRSSSTSSSSISIPSTSPTNTIISPKTPTTPPTLSTSLTPSPSPLLLPTYRPPSSLLSTTPRAAFPPVHVPKSTTPSRQEIEDGSERICVEALVVRKEMEGHLNFEDVGRWMSGGGKWTEEEDPLNVLAALV